MRSLTMRTLMSSRKYFILMNGSDRTLSMLMGVIQSLSTIFKSYPPKSNYTRQKAENGSALQNPIHRLDIGNMYVFLALLVNSEQRLANVVLTNS